MPKIFEQDGFVFLFYSNEHRPIHVHVRRGGGEAVFEVEEGVALRESSGMAVRELARAEVPMRVIPVIDLQAGVVVRGAGGQRSAYRPVASRLSDTATPEAIARALAEHFGPREVYLADLNAIAGEDPDWPALDAIAEHGHRILLDAGVGTPARASTLFRPGHREACLSGAVVGLESLADPQLLESTYAVLRPLPAAFSLDLHGGRLWNVGPAWTGWSPESVAALAAVVGFQRLIVLDVTAVGMGSGPVVGGLCGRLRSQLPGVELIAGGGIRHAGDIEWLRAHGCNAVLAASALHDGRLTADDVRRIEAGDCS